MLAEILARWGLLDAYVFSKKYWKSHGEIGGQFGQDTPCFLGGQDTVVQVL